MPNYPFDAQAPSEQDEPRKEVPLEQIIGPSPSRRSHAPIPSPFGDIFDDAPPIAAAEKTYFPLLETLRLYAGWLLGWYFLIYALGGYQITRRLPFHLPYVDDLVTSTSVATVSFFAFLFLLLTSLHRAIAGTTKAGVAFTAMGVLAVVGFWASL